MSYMAGFSRELARKQQKGQIRKDTIKDRLLGKATELGMARLTEQFKIFGFKEVVTHTW